MRLLLLTALLAVPASAQDILSIEPDAPDDRTARPLPCRGAVARLARQPLDRGLLAPRGGRGFQGGFRGVVQKVAPAREGAHHRRSRGGLPIAAARATPLACHAPAAARSDREGYSMRLVILLLSLVLASCGTGTTKVETPATELAMAGGGRRTG